MSESDNNTPPPEGRPPEAEEIPWPQADGAIVLTNWTYAISHLPDDSVLFEVRPQHMPHLAFRLVCGKETADDIAARFGDRPPAEPESRVIRPPGAILPPQERRG